MSPHFKTTIRHLILDSDFLAVYLLRFKTTIRILILDSDFQAVYLLRFKPKFSHV